MPEETSAVEPEETNTVEPISVDIQMDLEWRYSSGEAMERLLTGLRERKIQALRCPVCNRRYLPPRPFCGNCKVRLNEWVAVGDTGTLVAWTVVHQPIRDGRTGEIRPGPYGMGLILLDGADTTLNHYLAETDPARLKIGLRVRAVWREELRGSMDDIACFEVIQ